MPSKAHAFTPAEAAEILGMSVKVLTTLRRTGQIGYRTNGAGTVRPRVVYSQADIDAYVASAHRGATLPRYRR